VRACDDEIMAAARTVVFVVYDGAQLIELAGPADVLTAANQAAGRTVYRVVTASPRGRAVTMAGGHMLNPAHALRELASAAETIDTMIVIGGGGVFDPAVRAEVVPELPALARRSRRIASVCAGALLLAAAGLLDGYRATTHWDQAEAMALRHPRVSVEPDSVYVRDRDRWTSAGVTAGIDLALAFVEADLGTELAQQIARWFVLPARRPGLPGRGGHHPRCVRGGAADRSGQAAARIQRPDRRRHRPGGRLPARRNPAPRGPETAGHHPGTLPARHPPRRRRGARRLAPAGLAPGRLSGGHGAIRWPGSGRLVRCTTPPAN
jgi:putative intracellular protease/amidase